MHGSRHLLTPLAAVAGGILAGAVGTVCLDAVQYLKYRRSGGTEDPLAWEFAPIDSWDKAPDPGQVAFGCGSWASAGRNSYHRTYSGRSFDHQQQDFRLRGFI